MQSFYKASDLVYRDHQGFDVVPHVRLIFSLSDFNAIKDPSYNLLIARWKPSEGLRAQIQNASFDELAAFDFVCPKSGKDFASFAPDPISKAVLDELSESIAAFARLHGDASIRIGFTKACDQPCPLFHVDHVHFRLICTLKGPGTEWLKNSDVNRKSLAKGSNKGVAKEEAYLQGLMPFQIAVLKGEKCASNRRKGLVHRSPPLGSNEWRWFLKVDFRA